MNFKNWTEMYEGSERRMDEKGFDILQLCMILLDLTYLNCLAFGPPFSTCEFHSGTAFATK